MFYLTSLLDYYFKNNNDNENNENDYNNNIFNIKTYLDNMSTNNELTSILKKIQGCPDKYKELLYYKSYGSDKDISFGERAIDLLNQNSNIKYLN